MEIRSKDVLLNQGRGGSINNIQKGTLIASNQNLDNAINLKIEDISLELRLHQRLVLMYMLHIEQGKKMSIYNSNLSIKSNFVYYCDPVGTGKSIVILALICNSYIRDNNDELQILNVNVKNYSQVFSNEQNVIFTNLPNREVYINTNVTSRDLALYNLSLIVVPHNIILQWKEYIENYTSINYHMVHKKSDILFLQNIDNLKNIKILLVSNAKYNQVCNYLENITIGRLIVDEIDSINIPNSSNKIDAKYFYFISSSIGNIMRGYVKNNGYFRQILSENWYLFRENNKFHELYLLRNDTPFINQSMQLPSLHFKNIICHPGKLYNILNGFLNRDVIRMFDAEAHNDIRNYYNIEETSETNLVHVICKRFQIEIQNKTVELDMSDRMTFQSEEHKQNRINQLMKDINEIENKIKTIRGRISTNDMDPITLDNIGSNYIITKCCHNKFSTNSIFQSLSFQNKCPVCRSHLSRDDLLFVNDSKINEKKLDKFDQLSILLSNFNKNSKTLIFSQYNESFKKIEEICINKQISFSYVKGSASRIKTILDCYWQGNLSILLLNAQNYGAGINLQNTDNIILFHGMSGDLEHQIIGRAYRLQREKELYVYRLQNMSTETCIQN